MCNPPFYSSHDEITSANELKIQPSSAVPTAADNELITEGGEVAFVGKMIDESVHLRGKCL
jgi:23S rRNA A1618 N6-methylase RlmF